MLRSRLRHYQDKKERKQIVLVLVGMVGIILFLAVFGVRLLVGFSLLVDKIRGSSPVSKDQTNVVLIPPQLNPIPEATNSSVLKISGRVKGDVSVFLYVNDVQKGKVKADEDGTFTFNDISLIDGSNTVSAKSTDDKDNTSDLSEVLMIDYKKSKPNLDVTNPSEGAQISGEKAQVTITGITDPDNTVLINDRMAVVKASGSFSYDLGLKDGEQTITIIARDQAGNETKIERKVVYKK